MAIKKQTIILTGNTNDMPEEMQKFACAVLKHDPKALTTLAARIKRTLTNAVHRKGRKTA